jgi:hypothetical protein
MLRVALCTLLALAACHKESDPSPMRPREGELPPLPPSSGTPVGYLVDNASQLQLRDDQLAQLKDIDAVLAPKDDDIETQLRLIEKPEDDPPAAKGAPPARHNHAPGAQVKTTGDAAKLRSTRRSQDLEALQKAFALLDPTQQAAARRLLEDRGISPPGGDARPATPEPADGVPREP